MSWSLFDEDSTPGAFGIELRKLIERAKEDWFNSRVDANRESDTFEVWLRLVEPTP